MALKITNRALKIVIDFIPILIIFGCDFQIKKKSKILKTERTTSEKIRGIKNTNETLTTFIFFLNFHAWGLNSRTWLS